MVFEMAILDPKYSLLFIAILNSHLEIGTYQIKVGKLFDLV